MISQSHLVNAHNSVIVSRSVERDASQNSAQSNLQRKLRLKTNKQYKFITERQGGKSKDGVQKRPASTLVANVAAFQSAMNGQKNKDGS